MYFWDLVFTSEFIIQCLHFAVFSFVFLLNVFSNAACQHLNIRYTSVSIIGVPLEDCIQLSRANKYSRCTFCFCNFFRSIICIYQLSSFSLFCGECVKNNQKMILRTVVQLSNCLPIVCFHSFDRYFLLRSFPIHCVFGFPLSSHKEERCCQPITRGRSSKYAELSILYIWCIYSMAYNFFNIFKFFVCPWIYLWAVTLHLHSIQNNCV